MKIGGTPNCSKGEGCQRGYGGGGGRRPGRKKRAKAEAKSLRWRACRGGTFFFGNAPVRTMVKDGEVWFVAKDVAEILGYRDHINAIKQHCKGVVKHHVLSNGGPQEMTIIPERDVYRLIMRSNLPHAERFEEWVVGEVLPSIRKTGSYVAPQVNTEQATNLELFKLALGSIEETARRVDSITAEVKELQDTRKLEHWQASRLLDGGKNKMSKQRRCKLTCVT